MPENTITAAEVVAIVGERQVRHWFVADAPVNLSLAVDLAVPLATLANYTLIDYRRSVRARDEAVASSTPAELSALGVDAVVAALSASSEELTYLFTRPAP